MELLATFFTPSASISASVKGGNNGNITHHSQKVETSQGSPGGCADKQNVMYPSNRDHADLKRKGIVTHATAWINPEDTILGERMNPV